jgi:ADP-ribosyl-[dinitrogen reductase] hydrolase
LEAQDFDARIFRNKLARWWLVPPRLSSRSTKNAALKCLLHFKETGYDVPGSSGAMRAAPLGIFFRDNLDQLISKTVECCRITHTNNSAMAGALANAVSVAYALTHETFDQSAYLKQLCEIIDEFDKDLANRLQQIPAMLNEEEDVAIGTLLKNSTITGSPISDITMTAIYAFLKYPNDFEKSVLFCVNAGWDTDTMAAINGNIAGAFNGLNRIPTRWVERLEHGYKGRDYILKLASHLNDRSSIEKPAPFLIDYVGDFARNTAFISSMLIRKPMA